MKLTCHSGIFSVLLFFAAFSGAGLLFADDSQAVKVYSEGHALYEAHEYYQAAQKFELAGELAKSSNIKANALIARIGSWKMCGMMYREFECIDTLLTRYPEYADYKLLSERIYEIGDRYYAGEREPAYWHLRWIPWLNNGDKTIAIYQKALACAPFSKSAARTRLRLAQLFDKQGDVKESVVQLKKIIKEYPNSPEYQYSILALAEALFILSEKGDGDGRLAKEAHELLVLYSKKFPAASENSWVKRRMLQYCDLQAKRLFDMAEYYEDNGRKDASKRYYADILVKYPQSTVSADAEKKLIELDPGFVPEDISDVKASRLAEFRAYEIPDEATKILVSPASDNKTHYLQPVMDLHGPELKSMTNAIGDVKKKSEEKQKK